jgi:hypothetical protein
MGETATQRGTGQSGDLAVDRVVQHLVMLRGGGAFLSSRDSLQLLTWLDEGHSVPSILDALDRAAEGRRARRSRVPLALKHAKRHLTATAVVAEPKDPLLDRLHSVASGDGHRESLLQLHGRLIAFREAGMTDPTEGVDALRMFFEEAWNRQSATKRAALLTEAEETLGDLLTGLDASTCSTLLEETARSRLRAGYPWLTVAAVRALFQHVEDRV